VRRLVILSTLILFPALSSTAGDIQGRWWAEGGSAQVEIAPCGDRLCGTVVWLNRPLDATGCDLRDAQNPDPALRSRPVLGLRLLEDLRLESDGSWGDGRIYDPEGGRHYSVQARLGGRDRLRLRGYLGIELLGRTTTWTRVGTENQCTAGST
jgi:uncharacterized protein (DUF2147 family)